jgi:hypothetical protein
MIKIYESKDATKTNEIAAIYETAKTYKVIIRNDAKANYSDTWHYYRKADPKHIQELENLVKANSGGRFLKHYRIEHQWVDKRTGDMTSCENPTDPILTLEAAGALLDKIGLEGNDAYTLDLYDEDGEFVEMLEVKYFEGYDPRSYTQD